MPDYDSMPAGREMDALVAEKVMGWRSGIINETCRVIRLPYGGPGWEPWSPSTSISAAWEVVEKLSKPMVECEDGDFWLDGLGYPRGDSWRCWFTGEMNGTRIESWADAPTAPLAICRAALKAMS